MPDNRLRESMKDAHLTSTYKMFYGGYDQKSYRLSNMTDIEGMENLVTDEVTNYISSSVEQAARGKASVKYNVSKNTCVVIYLEGILSLRLFF